ncbi:ATP-dependent DNA ligase [Actinomycetospora sp. TBRC 11914]|uniref:ATP-dependent DNA ligase n=1 Tax=Actinomycetospora sp. TBRC 11914 TaxID=2729387 RepID=UPI00145D2ABD|nr:ATP-dependent DNA ligase [Actinomycetospora sp. TBRC 11914]NMO88871.1 ATP-dependent DNA ligase [Actinomycetospora sp. TBRC 11914]
MLLAAVVDASSQVAATRSRKAKTAALAAVLAAAGPDEVRPVTAWLAGDMLQGRTGIGWRTLSSVQVEPAQMPTLSVTDVEAALDRLAALAGSGTGVGARRTAELEALLGAATADEGRFLVRLLGGELRQGALEGLMIEAVATAAEVPGDAVRRAFMLSGQLPTTAVVALTSDDPVAALGATGLEVMRPLRPMLASPGDSLEETLAGLGPDVVVEHKLDGARIQVHRRGDEVRVWSRTLHEITEAVPEIVALVREMPVETVVLDGETLAVSEDGRPRPFQDSMKGLGSGAMRPWFFDCLHRDGVDLVDEPLETRRREMAAVVGDRVIPGVVRPSPAEAAAEVEAALAAGQEGSMVKALDSAYTAGRRGKSWQKIKPAHTLDLVVLACEWGSGRRRGWLSNIHLGAGGSDGEFVMVGKTFKGMTDETLRWQTETFPRYETARDAHTVYLRPEVVVEIELDGVQTSTRYPGGVALRFARVVRYRDDKPASEADTIDAVRGLRPT